MTKRRVLLVALLFLVVGTASARQYLEGERCTIPAGETLVGTLFVFCQDLVIDGTLDGNLIGAAVNADVTGKIQDSVYLVGGQFDLRGTLGDNLHFAGAALHIHEGATFGMEVSDLITLTMSTSLDAGTAVPGSIIAAGYQLLLRGDVGGEVNFWGAALEVNGRVGGDIAADVGDAEDIGGTAQLESLFIVLPSVRLNLVNPGLRVSEASQVGGLLRYRSPTPGNIPNEVVAGGTFFEEILQQPQIADITDEETVRMAFQQYFGAVLREWATLAVVGALGLVFAPGLTQAPIRNLRERPLTSLGVGTLTFILSFPVVVIAILASALVIFALTLLQAGNLTIAGTVVLLLLDVGGASLFYFVAIFVARSVVCLALGRRLLRLVFEDDGTMRFLYVGLLLGSVLVAVVVSLPVFGWLMNALTLFLGLGAIVNLIQVQLRNIREGNVYGTAGVPPSGARFGMRRYQVGVEQPMLPESVPPPRPRLPRPRHTVGTDNLPDDFIWWDDL